MSGSSSDNQRKIIHVDMDAFYASVEQRDAPELRGKPVAVGGSPNSRGVVASASYEARRFGVRSAMSSSKAQRLCPNLVFVYPRISFYWKISQQIQEIFRSVTPLVEPLSLDEAYLDVTQNSLNEPLAKNVAIHIQNRIRDELHLSASAGVGPNKFIAKVASDLKKPNGLVVVPPHRVCELVEKLPVEKFWGVGPATAKRLHEIGIWTGADIKKCSLQELEKNLGKYASFLHDLANGIDDREVSTERETKSCGTETTFEKDVTDTRYLTETLQEQSEGLARDLKEMDKPARTVTIKVRYKDFKTITRSRTLMRRTYDPKVITKVATDLLLNSTEAGNRPMRLIGISLSGFVQSDEPEQLWLDLPYV